MILQRNCVQPSFVAITVAIGALLLAGCGLHMPDPAPYVAACDRLPEVAGTAQSPHFFVSTSIRDCRKERLDFSNFRSAKPIYGRSVITDEVKRNRGYLNAQRSYRAAWLEELQAHAASRGGGRMIVYVHGYNNDFADQLQRAEIFSGMLPEGVPIVIYDWTSRKRLPAYTVDEATAAWTQSEFDDLIADLAASGTDITVIAHSMGNRIAINGLLRLNATDPERARRVRRVVLASPDFDRDQAQRIALPKLLANGAKILIYASNKDRPIRSATGIHGYALLGSTRCRNDIDFNRRGRRPGRDCHLVAPRDNLAVVDTSEVAAGVTRHADFVDSHLVRQDLAAFLTDRVSIRRCLVIDDTLRTGFRIPKKLPCPAANR